MKKINLGCGHVIRQGYFNVDSNPSCGADLVVDLNKFPYPFEDASADEILIENSLEHLHDPLAVMKEAHRILKKGGRLIVEVPHFSRGITCSDHKRGFDLSFPYYFSPVYQENVGVYFSVTKARLNWFYQNDLKKKEINPLIYYSLVSLGCIFDFIANLCPYFCSRIWCFWVGGFDKIDFEFIKE